MSGESLRMKILITGASGEIGAAIAHKVAGPDQTLLLHYHHGVEQILQVKDVCEQAGSEVYCLQADLAQEDGAQVLLSQIVGTVDILIYAAGHSLQGLITEVTDDQLSSIMHVHLLNPIKMARALLPNMIQKKSGKIIVISSIWGVTGASYEVAYSAAKAGLNGFVKSLAKEIAPSGIQVNAVAPGAIQTKMLNAYSDDEIQALEADIPAGRLGKPEDVASTVSFLIGDGASYINGQIIEVNGAWN